MVAAVLSRLDLNEKRLRKARRDTGLLIKNVAAQIGVTDSTIINWENRRMKPWENGELEKRERIYFKNIHKDSFNYYFVFCLEI